jgi:hypothetical protein
MKVGPIILLLFFCVNAGAQVKTITIRKTLPYDTQHVTLTFDNSVRVMPRFVRGKNNFDLELARSYDKVVKVAGPKPGLGEDEKDSVYSGNDSLALALREEFYEGRVLDKAIFVKVLTYCDTDGSITVLPQERYDIYTLAAIAMVKQLPKFIPAQYEGENVPVYLTIPVRFLKGVSETPTKYGSGVGKLRARERCGFRCWVYRIVHPFAWRHRGNW